MSSFKKDFLNGVLYTSVSKYIGIVYPPTDIFFVVLALALAINYCSLKMLNELLLLALNLVERLAYLLK